MQLLLDSNGLVVKKRNNCFWIVSKKGRRQISPYKVTSIAVVADCLLSASAIRLATQHKIPIMFLNRAGKVESRLWSASFGSISTIRRKQVLFAETTAATEWLIEGFQLKQAHQINTLLFFKNRRPKQVEKIEIAIKSIEKIALSFDELRHRLPKACQKSMMGVEGSMARVYWQTIATLLPKQYQFAKRSRRPAEDYFNATLNYFYGMLYNVVEGGLFAAGLDPYLGFLHSDQYNKPTLTYDMIEPFRPWIDLLLIQQCLGKKLKDEYFEPYKGGCGLSKTGKKYLIPLFNDYMQSKRIFDHKRLSVKNHIYRFAGVFAQNLLKL